MNKLSILLSTCALATLGLAACGGDDTTSTSTSTNQSGPPVTNTTGGPAPSTVTLAADPSGALAYDTTELTAAAGQPHIEFVNDSPVGHDVTVEDANGNVIGQSDVITTTKRRSASPPSPTPTPSTARSTRTAKPAWRARSPSSTNRRSRAADARSRARPPRLP
jgi:plastocyanin